MEDELYHDDLEDDEELEDGLYELADGTQYQVENGTVYELTDADPDDDYDDEESELEELRDELIDSFDTVRERAGNRDLTMRETERLWDQFEREGTWPDEAENATFDLSDREQRREFMAQRMKDSQPEDTSSTLDKASSNE